MKNKILILSAASLSLLTACYDVRDDYSTIVTTVGELKTLPAVEEGKDIIMEGNAGDLKLDFLRFQVCRNKEFAGESRYFGSSNYAGLGRLSKIELSGTYYYRLCAVDQFDTIPSSNVESFTVDHVMSMNDPQKVEGTSAYLSFSTDVYSTPGFIMLSTDKEFKDCEVLNTEWTSQGSNLYEHYVIVRNLTPGTTYYAKGSMDMLLGAMETDVMSFTTSDFLKMGDVTYSGWDGNPYPFSDGYDHFMANITFNDDVVERNIEIYLTENGWKMAKDITPRGMGELWAYYSYNSQNANNEIEIQTYKYDNPILMWGMAKLDRDVVSSLRLRNQLARVVLYITVSDDYPIDNPTVENFTIAGNTLPTIASFNVNTGKWVFNQYAYSEPLGYWREVGLCKGETVEVVLYSIPCEKGMATATFNFWQNKYQSDIEIGWEAGKTYEYNVNVNTAGLSISDVKLKDWVPNEVGSIIINP